jgi:hypothetical protein
MLPHKWGGGPFWDNAPSSEPRSRAANLNIRPEEKLHESQLGDDVRYPCRSSRIHG